MGNPDWKSPVAKLCQECAMTIRADLEKQVRKEMAESYFLVIDKPTTMFEISKQVLEKALQMTDGNRTLASKLLDIKERTIYRYIKVIKNSEGAKGLNSVARTEMYRFLRRS